MLFNLSLLLVGILDIVGGYLFYRSHRPALAVRLYAVAGIGALGAGVFRLGTSDLHSIFALLAFVFFNLVAIGTGGVVAGPMRWLSFLAGAVGLVFVVLMVIGDGGNTAAFGVIGHGGTERMIVYPVMLWMLAFGGFLMATPGRTPPARRSRPRDAHSRANVPGEFAGRLVRADHDAGRRDRAVDQLERRRGWCRRRTAACRIR